MIAEWTGFLPTTKRLVEVESADPALLEACRQACAAREIELLPTPGVLTAMGAGLKEDSDAVVRMKKRAIEKKEDEEDQGGDIPLEEADLLAEVEHEGRKFVVMEAFSWIIGKKSE